MEKAIAGGWSGFYSSERQTHRPSEQDTKQQQQAIRQQLAAQIAAREDKPPERDKNHPDYQKFKNLLNKNQLNKL